MEETEPNDRTTILKELIERMRKGEISIGEILVAQNRAKRAPFPSDNENRLAEEVAKTEWEVRLRLTFANSLRTLC